MIAINAIGDNVDEGDNAADDANFFAPEHNRWSAPRRTSYTIRNCVAVPPKIDPRVSLHMVRAKLTCTISRPRDRPGLHAQVPLNSDALVPK